MPERVLNPRPNDDGENNGDPEPETQSNPNVVPTASPIAALISPLWDEQFLHRLGLIRLKAIDRVALELRLCHDS